MRPLTLALAGTLLAAAGLAGSAQAERPGVLREAPGKPSHVRPLPPGSLGEARIRRPRFNAPSISPHVGLPGISGFPETTRISPHIGLPGISGFPETVQHRRRHRRHGHGFDGDFGFVDWGYGYGDGDGYVDTIPYPDQFGFFATGGEVSMELGEPVYHYDRSYPYDWYRGEPRAGAPRTEAGLHCRVHSAWDEGARAEVPVRVCGPS